jgi:hypothetical protein
MENPDLKNEKEINVANTTSVRAKKIESAAVLVHMELRRLRKILHLYTKRMMRSSVRMLIKILPARYLQSELMPKVKD